jgi:hypothetical protein
MNPASQPNLNPSVTAARVETALALAQDMKSKGGILSPKAPAPPDKFYDGAEFSEETAQTAPKRCSPLDDF